MSNLNKKYKLIDVYHISKSLYIVENEKEKSS